MSAATPAGIVVYVDADACPVKQEIYKVAERHGLPVVVVSNSFINVPRTPNIRLQMVGEGLNVADDWIAEQATARDIVITNDIPLADRVVKKGALAIAPNGKLYDANSIGMALATRNLMQDLREQGAITGGPKPFSAQDRSRFLQAMHEAVVGKKRVPEP
ncbi:MAG: YaiI/YqxD family protein [Reyranellaceae bacterium]